MPSLDRKPCICAAGALRGAPASTRTTVRRARRRTSAALNPAAPPPTTATSYSSMPLSLTPKESGYTLSTGGRSAEVLSLFARHDERVPVGARSQRRAAEPEPIATYSSLFNMCGSVQFGEPWAAVMGYTSLAGIHRDTTPHLT